MGESILKLQQIRKSFDHTEVLKGVDLEVAQGEFITLLGASGCGKTTTLRIIAGLELPDSGSVILEGRDITDWEPNKRDVNTVFQNYALFPHMNVADNVGYGLKIRKVPKAEIAERVKQALDNTEGAVMASAGTAGRIRKTYAGSAVRWPEAADCHRKSCDQRTESIAVR